MYRYTFTVKEDLKLITTKIFQRKEPELASLSHSAEIPARDIDVIYQYLTEEEKEEFDRQKEYMLNGPGRVEAILNTEMEKLFSNMTAMIQKQDEEFIAKLPVKK